MKSHLSKGTKLKVTTVAGEFTCDVEQIQELPRNSPNMKLPEVPEEVRLVVTLIRVGGAIIETDWEFRLVPDQKPEGGK